MAIRIPIHRRTYTGVEDQRIFFREIRPGNGTLGWLDVARQRIVPPLLEFRGPEFEFSRRRPESLLFILLVRDRLEDILMLAKFFPAHPERRKRFARNRLDRLEFLLVTELVRERDDKVPIRTTLRDASHGTRRGVRVSPARTLDMHVQPWFVALEIA